MTNEEALEHLRELKTLRIEFPNTLQEQALDLAIKALETGEVYMTGEDYNLYMEGYKAGKRDFEPKQGEWVTGERNGEGYDYYCSRCMHITNEDINEINFCPKCGANMRKVGC